MNSLALHFDEVFARRIIIVKKWCSRESHRKTQNLEHSFATRELEMSFSSSFRSWTENVSFTFFFNWNNFRPFFCALENRKRLSSLLMFQIIYSSVTSVCLKYGTAAAAAVPRTFFLFAWNKTDDALTSTNSCTTFSSFFPSGISRRIRLRLKQARNYLGCYGNRKPRTLKPYHLVWLQRNGHYALRFLAL